MSVDIAGADTTQANLVEQVWVPETDEPTLFIHPDPLPPEVSTRVATPDGRIVEGTDHPLPPISEKPVDDFWRTSELGFATLWGLGGWGRTAAMQMFEDPLEVDAVVTAAERTARSLSSSNLGIESCVEDDKLQFDPDMGRVALRALRMGYDAAKVTADRATARTMLAAQRWVVRNVVLN